jgi:hypothetical protein
MNEIFNLRRFRLYFVKTLLEKPFQIVGTFVLSFSVVILIYFLLKSIANFELAQLFSFTVGLVGGGGLLASLVFGYFTDTASGSSYLTLPVSVFEKWLCAILLVGILYVGCFLLYFRGLDALFVHLYHTGLNPQDPRYLQQYNRVYLFSYKSEGEDIFIFFANAAAAMLVGSLYFNKVSFIKVSLVICGLYFFAFLLNYLVGSVLFKNLLRTFPVHEIAIKNGNEEGILVLPSGWRKCYDVMSTYLLPGILLVVSYIRLKEKEV